MYTEEVGVDPEADGGAPIYRSRVRQLIGLGWSFARIEEGRVVFKAEVAHATPHAAQIQGVWVAPDRRGEGLAAARGRGRRRGLPPRHRPGRLALRQHLERARPPGLRPRRLRADRHLRHHHVLIGAARALGIAGACKRRPCKASVVSAARAVLG